MSVNIWQSSLGNGQYVWKHIFPTYITSNEMISIEHSCPISWLSWVHFVGLSVAEGQPYNNQANQFTRGPPDPGCPIKLDTSPAYFLSVIIENPRVSLVKPEHT